MRTLDKIKTKTLLFVASAVAAFVVSCTENNDIPDNYYSSTKVTAAGFLEKNPELFSQFSQILQRANYYSLLSTYGEFTLFAPTNTAVSDYLSRMGYRSVDEIPTEMCDTLARTHIIKSGAFFTADVTDGALPQMNMDDRYIVLSSDSDVNNNNALVYYINKKAKMIEKDDSVTNGVVHVIDDVLVSSNLFLPDLIEADTTTQLFSQALALTGMTDSISRYLDEGYYCDDDSVTFGVNLHYGGMDWKVKFPEKRYFKFTAFVEPDSVFHEAGIYTIDDLKREAKAVYDAVYPEDAGLYDDNPRHRKNPLNRFVSYHLLDRISNYSHLVSSGDIKTQCCFTSVADPEDFYETMCPGTIMRICSPSDGLYINRKGLQRNATVRGCKILSSSESGMQDQSALNGVYHYLDRVLYYNTEVRDKVLNCRIRMDATTMSPDFMNAGVARIMFDTPTVTGFKNDYIKGWKASPETFIGVRGNEINVWSYEGNAICIKGIYDVQMKLPPVPSGTYEIRMGYSINPERGVLQAYLNNEACGIPVDLRIVPDGMVADTEDEEDNRANDKSLHNRGYMRAMDSYGWPDGKSHRDELGIMRRVLATAYLDPNKEYWLRLRQVLKDPELYCSFDYIELCPKSVYCSPEGEDTH